MPYLAPRHSHMQVMMKTHSMADLIFNPKKVKNSSDCVVLTDTGARTSTCIGRAVHKARAAAKLSAAYSCTTGTSWCAFTRRFIAILLPNSSDRVCFPTTLAYPCFLTWKRKSQFKKQQKHKVGPMRFCSLNICKEELGERKLFPNRCLYNFPTSSNIIKYFFQ